MPDCLLVSQGARSGQDDSGAAVARRWEGRRALLGCGLSTVANLLPGGLVITAIPECRPAPGDTLLRRNAGARGNSVSSGDGGPAGTRRAIAYPGVGVCAVYSARSSSGVSVAAMASSARSVTRSSGTSARGFRLALVGRSSSGTSPRSARRF